MRESFLFPGAVLLILMVIFTMIPIPVPQPTSVASNSPLRVGPPALPYSENTPITYQWSGGTASTWIQILPCQQANCNDIRSQVTAQGNYTHKPLIVATWSALGYGAQGSLTIWVPTNQTMMVVTNDANAVSLEVTWNEMPELSLFWEILTIIGILLCIAGMVLPAHGAPRGHQRRLHYFHWRHHPFALPPHLPPAGLACPACGLTDIPHEDDYCPRCHAPLPRASSTMSMTPMEPAAQAGPPPMSAAVAAGAPYPSDLSAPTPSPGVEPGPPREVSASGPSAMADLPAAAAGSSAAPAAAAADTAAAPPKKRTTVNRSKVIGQSLSVADADPMKPWRVVRGLGFQPTEVLVFTREDSHVLEERYHLDPAQIFNVSRSDIPHAVSPGEGDKIADLAQRHLREHPGGAVVLTDPNYIVTHVGFESLQRLVHALQDEARDARGTFILAFNPQVLSPEQRAHLEERMRKVL
jgi:hypothetical protein